MQQAGLNTTGGEVPIPSADLTSIVNQCYQCGKCSAGCPVASEMDLLPHQLVRLAVLGQVGPIIESKSFWLCLTCHTCGARCPNGIDVPTLLDPIRHEVLRKKIRTKDQAVPIFHTVFMNNVRRFGRVYELSLIGTYKMKTGTYFSDMKLGLDMFMKGKIHLLPPKVSSRREVEQIFNTSSMK